MFRLTVTIPTHGRPTLLGRTLDSLAACRLPAGYAETVVVENGPQAGAEAVVAAAAAAYPHLCLRYFHVEWANKSHALNEALATVGDGLVVFFDDDVRLDPGVLEAYSEATVEHPKRAFFGGPFACDYEEEPPNWLIPFFPPSARGVTWNTGGLEHYLGFNWAAYADEILGLGGFDPNFGPGSPSGATGQEGDMHARMMEAGFQRSDVPEAMVWHYVPRSRSTPRWVVMRKYRHGLASRRFDKDKARESLAVGKSIAGSLRCMLVAAKKFALRDEVGMWRALFGVGASAGQFWAALQRNKSKR